MPERFITTAESLNVFRSVVVGHFFLTKLLLKDSDRQLLAILED